MATKEMELVRHHVSIADLIQRAGYETVAAFETVLQKAEDYIARRAAARQMAALSDHLLQDIGVARHEILTKTGLK